MSQTIRNLLNELAFEFSIDELTPNNLVKKDVLHGIGENNRDITDYFGKVLDAQLSNTAYRQLQEKVQLFRRNFLNKSATFIEAYITLIQEINHLAIPLPEKIKAGLGRSSIRTVRLHIKPEKLIFSLADKANLDAYIHFNNEVQKLQQEYPCLYALLTQPNVRKQWLRLGVVAAVRALLLNYHQGQSLQPLRDVFGVETDSAFLMNAIAEAQSNAVENIDPMFLREPRNSPASSATHEMHFLRALKYLTTGEIEAFYAGLGSCFEGLDEKATKELFQKMLQHPTLKKAVAVHQISLAAVVKRLAEKNDIVKLQWAHLKVELADKINLNDFVNQFERDLKQRKTNLLYMMRTVLHVWEKTLKRVEELTAKNAEAFRDHIDFISGSLKAIFARVPVPSVGAILEKTCDTVALQIKENVKGFQGDVLKFFQKEILIQFEAEISQSTNRDVFKIKSLMNDTVDLSLSSALNELYVSSGQSHFFDKNKLTAQVQDFFAEKIAKPINHFCQFKLAHYESSEDYARYFPHNAAGDVITSENQRSKEQLALEKSIGQQVWNQWLANPMSNARRITYTEDIWLELGKNDMVFLPKTLRDKARSKSLAIASAEEQLYLQRNMGEVVDSSLALNRDVKQKLFANAISSLNETSAAVTVVSSFGEQYQAKSAAAAIALQQLPKDFQEMRAKLSAEIPAEKPVVSSVKENTATMQLNLMQSNLQNLENTEVQIKERPTRFGRFLSRVKKFTHDHPWATPVISVVAGIGAFFGWKVVVACAVLAGVKAAVVSGSTFLAAKALGAAGGAAVAEEAARKTVDYVEHHKPNLHFFHKAPDAKPEEPSLSQNQNITQHREFKK